MGYIGKQPIVGNFQVCDAISVVNGQAAYSLTVGGAAVNPAEKVSTTWGNLKAQAIK